MDASSILVLIGYAASVIALVSGAVALVRFLRRYWRARPRYRRITRSSDAAWAGVKLIHEDEFSTETGDDIADMKAWIDLWREQRKNPAHDLEEILMISQQHGRVLGYFYGQYYKSFGMLFASYLAIDRNNTDAKVRGAELLAEGLYAEMCKQDGFRGIVAELEDRANTWTRLSGDAQTATSKAAARFKAFDRLARAINKTNDTNLKVYRIDADYYQPFLREADIQAAPSPGGGSAFASSRGSADFKQWLIWLPFRSGPPFMDKDEAARVFEFIFEKVYGDAFPQSETYRAYLDAERAAHIAALPERVTLATHC